MTNEEFYKQLWDQKSGLIPYRGKERDWFHRLILDPILPPEKHTRHTIAGSLLPSCEKLLDVGCGNGESAKAMGAFERARVVYGVDIADAAVREAGKKGIVAFRVDLDNARLPFEDEQFDVVTCLAVLEHLFDPTHCLREIARVLKPAGLLLVDVPNVASLSNRARILFGRTPVTSLDPGWDGGHLHYFTASSLKYWLTSENFVVLVVGATGAGLWARGLWPSLLSGELFAKCMKPSNR